MHADGCSHQDGICTQLSKSQTEHLKHSFPFLSRLQFGDGRTSSCQMSVLNLSSSIATSFRLTSNGSNHSQCTSRLAHGLRHANDGVVDLRKIFPGNPEKTIIQWSVPELLRNFWILSPLSRTITPISIPFCRHLPTGLALPVRIANQYESHLGASLGFDFLNFQKGISMAGDETIISIISWIAHPNVLVVLLVSIKALRCEHIILAVPTQQIFPHLFGGAGGQNHIGIFRDASLITA